MKRHFTIDVELEERWVPHFLAMLKYMQYLGGVGASRMVSFYADGDGDFHPKFRWDPFLKSDGKPIKDDDGNKTFDAG